MTASIALHLDVVRAHVRAYAESNMDGAVTVLRGGRGTLDPITGVVSGMAGAVTIYTGRARLHTIAGQGGVAMAAAGDIDTRAVTISIPWAAALPQRDDVVRIDSGGADTTMNGRAARVLEVEGGGLFGDARRMQCVVWGTSEYWTGTGGDV